MDVNICHKPSPSVDVISLFWFETWKGTIKKTHIFILLVITYNGLFQYTSPLCMYIYNIYIYTYYTPSNNQLWQWKISTNGGFVGESTMNGELSSQPRLIIRGWVVYKQYITGNIPYTAGVYWGISHAYCASQYIYIQYHILLSIKSYPIIHPHVYIYIHTYITYVYMYFWIYIYIHSILHVIGTYNIHIIHITHTTMDNYYSPYGLYTITHM